MLPRRQGLGFAWNEDGQASRLSYVVIPMQILTINGGSSSIKWALFEQGEPPMRSLQGRLTGIGSAQANFLVKDQTRTVKQALRDKLIQHKQYITEHGEDMPDIRDWKWRGE